MDKSRMIYDLKNIAYTMGRHSGLWEHCNDRKELAKQTFKYMEENARNYGIETKDNIKEYDCDYYDGQEEYAYDEVAYELFLELIEKIEEELLK